MPDITEVDNASYLERALRAADWYVNSQLSRFRPDWDANDGRFLYYYCRLNDKYVPGINWTQGRALFVLSEAYKITGEEKYRTSAERGAAYIAGLQVMDPYFDKTLGSFREHTAMTPWCSLLDGAQSASGLLMLEKVTGTADYLRRGRAFCDLVLRHFTPEKGMPTRTVSEPEEVVTYNEKQLVMTQCVAMPLWHLYKRTGEDKYLAPVIYGADFTLACQREDGALLYRKDPESVPPPRTNHHEGRGEGEARYVLHNDDGIVTIILAAYEATKDQKYLDAAVKYADYITGKVPNERPFCCFPVQANNVLDIGRMAGKDYSGWVLDHLKTHLIDLQVGPTGHPMADGGFRGEDEEDEGGIFGGRSLDYITNRVTCYSAGTLFRLSGQGTGAGFSVWGLE